MTKTVPWIARQLFKKPARVRYEVMKLQKEGLLGMKQNRQGEVHDG